MSTGSLKQLTQFFNAYLFSRRETSRYAGHTAPRTLQGQLQPEVLPHDGHAWHEPARCICTPHCMHIGASLCVMTRGMPCAGEWSVLGASGARPALICAASSPAEGMVFGSCAISLPLLVSTMVSSTPGNVGCKRSSRLKMPSSTRSS